MVMSRPPAGAAVACTVPLWTVAMEDTRARPRPKPSWRVRSSSRVNGRNSRSTISAGTTGPVLTTRRTDVPSLAAVDTAIRPPGDVVALGVVDQVGDEPFEQDCVAGDRRFVERGRRRDAVGGTSLKCVLGDGGQIQRVGESQRLIAPGQYQQYLDEPLGVADGLADLDGHRDQFLARGLRPGQDDVHRRAHDGQRRAELMAGVGDELPLAGKRAVEPFEHRVEGVGELLQLVARALQGDALGQVLFAGGVRSRGER